MDPNVALLVLRDAVKEYLGDVEYDIADRLDEVMYAFNALDEWLTNGGFVPTAWERKDA